MNGLTEKINQTQSLFPARELGPVAGRPCPLAAKPAPPPPPPQPEEKKEQPVVAPKKEKEQKKTWIEIMLVDMEGKPVAGARYRITAPNGEVKEGALNEFGQAGLYQIDPGNCKITFPDYDAEAWETY